MLPRITTLLLATSLGAQVLTLPASLQPANNELNSSAPVPFMGSQTRAQFFFSASECGASSFTVRAISFRPDGPKRSTATGSRRLNRLTLDIGTTAIGTDRLDAVMAANLSTPLVNGIAGIALDLPLDGNSIPGPESFGGSNGQLRLPLQAPVPIAIATGHALALELTTSGNAMDDSLEIDFAIDASTSQSPGSATSNGNGCPAALNSNRATLDTTGFYIPGGSFTMFGTGYAPNQPVFTLLTARLFTNSLALPFTNNPTCWLYVDNSSGLALAAGSSNGGGELPPHGPGNTLPVPRQPRMCGTVLYVQNASPIPQFANNQLGFLTSNYRTVVIGCPGPATLQAWSALHHERANASIASLAFPGAPALRIE